MARTPSGREQRRGRGGGRADEHSPRCGRQNSPYTVALTKVNDRRNEYCWTMSQVRDGCPSGQGECCVGTPAIFVLRSLGESLLGARVLVAHSGRAESTARTAQLSATCGQAFRSGLALAVHAALPPHSSPLALCLALEGACVQTKCTCATCMSPLTHQADADMCRCCVHVGDVLRLAHYLAPRAGITDNVCQLLTLFIWPTSKRMSPDISQCAACVVGSRPFRPPRPSPARRPHPHCCNYHQADDTCHCVVRVDQG